MSVFKDKRVFGIKRKNSSGISTAGQVCANDVILWMIFMLPINIVIHGAGQCFVAIGLFVGNVIGWIFLAKRMNSYADISPRKIHNAPELFAARYDSWLLKYIVSMVWIVTLGTILLSVLKVIVSVAAYFLDIDKNICLAAIVLFLVLATIMVDNRLMGIIKTIVFIMVILACIVIIFCIFYSMDVREILENYRRSKLNGGTSIYLNILYYDGEHVDIGRAVSMTGVGLGCIAMPLMYKGVMNISGVKELDAGRIWAIVFEGFTILSSCMLDLLVVPVIFPEKTRLGMNSFQVYNMMLKKLFGDGTYAYAARFFILLTFIVAVVVMLESFMRNICEHIRGLIPSMSNVGQITKLIIDIGVVVTAGVLIFVFAEFTEYDLELAIVQSWGICAAALAAPLMCTLMYRNATRSGMYAGIAAGVAVYVIWQFIPAVGGTSIGAYLGISGDVAGFTASMIFCIAVSMFTPKNREDELRVFDRMKADQA